MQNINEYPEFIAAVAEQNACLAKITEIETDLVALRREKYTAGSLQYDFESQTVTGLLSSMSETPDIGHKITTLERQFYALKGLVLPLQRKVDQARRNYAELKVQAVQKEYSKLEEQAIKSLLSLQSSILQMLAMESVIFSETATQPPFKRVCAEIREYVKMPDRYHALDNDLFRSLKNNKVQIPGIIEKALTH